MADGPVEDAAAERARLFVALELPAPVTGALSDWAADTVGHRAGLRLVRRDSLHVTLCFLGMRPVGEVGAIAAACRSAVQAPGSPVARADSALGAAVWLPRRRPRVLAVELIDHDGSLARLQRAVAAALVELGVYEPETRPYLAHVTVARVARPWPRSTPAPLDPPDPIAFVADRVTLFRSRLGGGPARYEALQTVVLGGG